MESKSGVCTKNTYVKSAKNRGEILVPVVSKNLDSNLDWRDVAPRVIAPRWDSSARSSAAL